LIWLKEWLSLDWTRPERSYNPNVRDFLASMLGYPKDHVVTEDSAGEGYADIQLTTPDGEPWIVGDLKKDDLWLFDPDRREQLWVDKRKYVSGTTRYVLFLTPHALDVRLPNGERLDSVPSPILLAEVDASHLRTRLAFMAYEAASHERQWQVFICGKLPYSYLTLGVQENQRKLQFELTGSFRELTEVAEAILNESHAAYVEYSKLRDDIKESLATDPETQRRALNRLAHVNRFPKNLFEDLLPSFEEQYGRDMDVSSEADRMRRIIEAFAADSVAALVARVLFLRLVEDLGLTLKRRLSNGGPEHWSSFVEELTGDAGALFRAAAEDVSRIYSEPFEPSVFDWIQEADSKVGTALQRLIIRLNAYDFSTLSEEILGDIYQQFLPLKKRKRLGEYYTPSTIAGYLLGETVQKHGRGRVLDPACGSGSFLVREVHTRIEDAQRRGLDPESVIEEILHDICGFDINPFAAFITRFQIMWALLRFSKDRRDPQPHVYNINSLLKDSSIAKHLGTRHLPPGSIARDSEKWKYVVGNPPYIRAERVKYGEEMRKLYQGVWGQNADTGLLFLDRAILEWLEPGGRLGMVVSGGYANSEAAAPVWTLLQPGESASLRKIVWLEFIASVWAPNVIPMLLVIEKVPARETDIIELAVPRTWPHDFSFESIKYSDFFDARISPNAAPNAGWGRYLLPLLVGADIPVLRSLYPDQQTFVPLRYAVEPRRSRGRTSYWTYGIQRGGAQTTREPISGRSLRVFSGGDIAVASLQASHMWLDLDQVERRNYGKLSLWSQSGPTTYLAVNEIGLAPAAVVVTGEPHPAAALNSVVVALPRAGGPLPEAVAAYLNSDLARFYWATTLRSGVLEGSSRSHLYPRVLEALPWPRQLSSASEKRLHNAYKELEVAAQRTISSPEKWLVESTASLSPEEGLRLTDPLAGLTFRTWSDPMVDELEQNGDTISSGLSSLTLADEGLAQLAVTLLRAQCEDQISRHAMQSLVVPKDWRPVVSEYRKRLDNHTHARKGFESRLRELNEAAFEAFGISKTNRLYIETRLATFPLSRLNPRYPWVPVKKNTARSFEQDRFE